jgi:hypothetical protein
MTDDIPAHRKGFAARSGDTLVIGADGKTVNVDQQARDQAAAAAKKPEPRGAAKPVLELAEVAPAKAETTQADPK